MSDFSEKMKKVDQRMLAGFDRDLQEFRLSYRDAMTDVERKQVAGWLRELVKLEKQSAPWPGIAIKIVVSHDLTDQDGECFYSGGASFNPRVLLEAVEAWERGEEFLPRAGAATV